MAFKPELISVLRNIRDTLFPRMITAESTVLASEQVVLDNEILILGYKDEVEADRAEVEINRASVAANRVWFDGIYLGASATTPTLDLNGYPLTGNELYFDTSDVDITKHVMKVYNGTSWNPAYGVAVSEDLALGANSAIVIVNDRIVDGSFDEAVNALQVLNGIYLGAKSVAPTLDLNGEALTGGELYFDTAPVDPVDHIMKAYNGVSWNPAYGIDIASDAITFTNKTLKDASNDIHVNGIHFEIQALEDLVRGDVLVVEGTSDVTFKVVKRTSLTQAVVGIMETDTLNTEIGLAVSIGVMKQLSNDGVANDGVAWEVNDVLYPNATGGLTKNASIATGNYNQPIAIVVKSNNSWITVEVNVHSGHEDASLISFLSGLELVATNVASALDELQNNKESKTVVATKAPIASPVFTGDVKTTSGDLIASERLMWEGGKHSLTSNDGLNVALRFAHESSAGDLVTEDGFASRWHFSQTNGTWTFDRTATSQLTGETCTWVNHMNIDANGIVNMPLGATIGSVSNTEIDYLNGVTSALQAQLDGKIGDSGKSLTTNGYQKLSNGLIIQWGTAIIGITTLPMTFPNACLSVSANGYGVTGRGDVVFDLEYCTTSNIKLNYNYYPTAKFIAIGH